MNKPIAIVTGSSSGFGLLTSLELAKLNFHVIATMRNTEKGYGLMEQSESESVAENIEIQQLDVTSESSIQRLKEYIEKIGTVDVLVNNAGYAGAGFVEEIPIDEYRQQFETNFFGLIAVTQAFLPMMRNNNKGKIINVSSISGRVGFPGISPYVASKHALEGWSECLRLEMLPYGVEVCLIEPGSYQTNIWSTGKQVTEKSQNENSPYYSYMRKIEKHLEEGQANFGDPLEIARKIGEIANKNNSTLRYPIGKGVRLSISLKNSLPWKTWEKLFIKLLK